MMTEEQRLINETLKTSRDYLIEQAEFTAERLKEYDKCSERMFALMALEYMRLAALTQPASPALKLPDGWVAVPREATIEMIESGWTYSVLEKNATAKGTWACMVAAAPAVPHTAPIEPVRQAFKVGDIVEQSGDIAEVLCAHSNGALDVRELKSGKHYGWSSGMCVLIERAKEG